jgi:N-acyl-L-homoserine lactone synthetase
MEVEQLRGIDISPAVLATIAAYRYGVFVESLGWQLPCAPGRELDEFDVPGATHLVAAGERGIVGYARMLPTTGEYLLETHFPFLFNGATPPKSPRVLELSRFAAGALASSEVGAEADGLLRTSAGKLVLLEAINCAMSRGADHIVFCTTVAIERLAKRWGVDIRRIGPPVRSHGQLLVAATIVCNNKSVSALLTNDMPSPLPCEAAWALAAPSAALHSVAMPAAA